uniref:Myofilin n=1 Tax=Timema bartmani TaxID=61472 RepID=A0A7R9F8D4_9NEOP|nr:unnamed protein product [Timema bartmani]
MLRNHLDMIGRNEPIQKKAKFWQSYVRALKGTDDMRAPERISSRPRSLFHPLSSDFPELGSWPYSKSIYDDPSTANERMTVPGYRYQPVSRETYGYSPRNLYPRSAYYPSYDSNKPWADHLKRLADIDRFYPSKYPLSYRYGVAAPAPRRAVSAAPSEKAVAFNYAGCPTRWVSSHIMRVRRPAHIHARWDNQTTPYGAAGATSLNATVQNHKRPLVVGVSRAETLQFSLYLALHSFLPERQLSVTHQEDLLVGQAPHQTF